MLPSKLLQTLIFFYTLFLIIIISYQLLQDFQLFPISSQSFNLMLLPIPHPEVKCPLPIEEWVIAHWQKGNKNQNQNSNLTVFFMSQQLNPYIEYFATFSQIPNSLNVFDQFHDSLFITQLLSQINSFPHITINTQPKTFSDKFSNLKEIYTKLKQFWKHQLNLESEFDEINLIEIASHENPQQIKKLLQLVLKTGIQSSKKDYFIQKMLMTSSKTQNHFMNLIDKALNQQNQESPRKQRERYLLDQIIILEQENDGLYEIVKEYEQINMDLKQKNEQKEERLKIQQGQIEKLNYKIAQITQTPQKKKQPDYFDTNEKNVQYIQKLKDRILEMAKQHEQQTIAFKGQIDFFSCKMEKMHWLENQLEMYKVKVQSNKQAIEQYDDLSKKLVEMKRTLIEKSETISEYERKLSSKNHKIQSLEEKLVEHKLQIERKNVQLAELGEVTASKYTFDEISNFSSTTINRTLSEQCPEVINHQAEHLSEINRELRGQLERSAKALREAQAKIERMKRQYHKVQNFGQENKKLTEMLNQVSEQAEEEKSLILGALYEVRMRYMREVVPNQKVLRNQTKRNLSRTIKKCH